MFPGSQYSLDVKFNDNKTKILASRFLIQAVNISGTIHETQMVRDLRQICKEAPLNVSVFHPYFVFFDQFELIGPTALKSMIVGAGIMMLIAYLFIPEFRSCIWVALCIVSIQLGVVGYMSLWDVNLDSISMINLIMCIGFSVDYTAHICYAYMSCKAKHPDKRVKYALYSLGWPIVQGAVSTALGCIGLLLAASYIFLVFYKIIFLVVFFGAMHGLFLLPVLLSLFGPGSCTPHAELLAADEAEEAKYKASNGQDAEKRFASPSYVPHPLLALTRPFGVQAFIPSPYNPYGNGGVIGNTTTGGGMLEEKDQGIGTSGEDSSESSSSKSQRRQALEDENTKRRYEEGWRRSSSHNLSNGPSQFQPAIDLYGVEAKRMWSGGQTYTYEDSYGMQRSAPQRRTTAYDFDHEIDRRKIMDDGFRSRYDSSQPKYFDTSFDSGRYGYGDDMRHYNSDENKRKLSDERRNRKYSPPEGIYRPNPHRSSSQHNLYFPRQPQRSSSYHNIHQLRHMGDIRFP